MAKLSAFLAASVLALAASAAPSPSSSIPVPPPPPATQEKRQCTTTILPPADLINFDLAQPNVPGWSVNPFFEVARDFTGNGGYKQVVRFNPPSTGTCSWVLSLPQASFDSGAILQGKPSTGGPVNLAVYGMPAGGYAPGKKLSELNIKPGPFSVPAIQPGTQVLHAEPCNQIGGDMFVEIPPWVTEQEWVYWMQNIKTADAANSLGLYMQVSC